MEEHLANCWICGETRDGLAEHEACKSCGRTNSPTPAEFNWRCPHCGYDRSANPDDRPCPECGQEWAAPLGRIEGKRVDWIGATIRVASFISIIILAIAAICSVGIWLG